MTPVSRGALALADRLTAVDQRLNRIAEDRKMSVGAQATAIAMVTTMNADLFASAAASLRALAAGGE